MTSIWYQIGCWCLFITGVAMSTSVYFLQRYSKAIAVSSRTRVLWSCTVFYLLLGFTILGISDIIVEPVKDILFFATGCAGIVMSFFTIPYTVDSAILARDKEALSEITKALREFSSSMPKKEDE